MNDKNKLHVKNKANNYAFPGFNFKKIGQIEYGLAKIKAKLFFLHMHLIYLVQIGSLVAIV